MRMYVEKNMKNISLRNFIESEVVGEGIRQVIPSRDEMFEISYT